MRVAIFGLLEGAVKASFHSERSHLQAVSEAARLAQARP